MGNLLAAVSKYWRKKPDKRALMIGLDGAGKTTLMYKLKLGETIGTVPTVGFNVESLEFKSLTLTIWDLGGQSKIRPLWNHYFKNTDAIIFVVDSEDRKRLEQAKEELWTVLANPILAHAPLLIFANKQDVAKATTVQTIVEVLGLEKLRGRKWYIQGCSATLGDGVSLGINTLVQWF